MFLPTKENYNKNILICANVSENFILAYNDLISDNKIKLKDESIAEFLLAGSPYYPELKVANKDNIKTQEKIFLPTSLNLVND